jgi:hypothetical protein
MDERKLYGWNMGNVLKSPKTFNLLGVETSGAHG